MTTSANHPEQRPTSAVPISSAATGIAGIAAGAALGWKALEVNSNNGEGATSLDETVQQAPSTSPPSICSLHLLQGTEVREEYEIAPVLDTAEEAGASHEDLMRFEALIRHNVQQGVAVVFGTEYGSGTMGQYDPENNYILITPETVDMGLEDTMKTLLHETVHAQQDMVDGLDNATMQSLGLEINTAGVDYVESNYIGLSQEETITELEANSAEYNVADTFDQLDVDMQA